MARSSVGGGDPIKPQNPGGRKGYEAGDLGVGPVTRTGRPSFHETFIEMCHLVSKRTTCPRRAVGAVIVKDNHVLTTGYNGAPKGFPHPIDTGCIREELGIPRGEYSDVCPCLHAEQNAILQAALFGVSVKDGTLYCTTQPCTQCARMVVNAGLKRVIFEQGYPDPLALGLLTTGAVELFEWDARKKEPMRLAKTNTWFEAQAQFKKSYLLQLTRPKSKAARAFRTAKRRFDPGGPPPAGERPQGRLR